MKNKFVSSNIHPIIYLLLSSSAIIFIILKKNIFSVTALSIMVSMSFLAETKARKIFLKTIWWAFLFSLPVVLMKLLWLSSWEFKSSQAIQIYIDSARLFFLFMISFLAAPLIDFEVCAQYFMQTKIISPTFGIPFIAAINSIDTFKSTFDSIQTNIKQRRLNFKDKIQFLFPIIIYSIYHSDKQSHTLISRGIKNQKSYYYDYSFTTKDSLLGLSFLIFFIILIVS